MSFKLVLMPPQEAGVERWVEAVRAAVPDIVIATPKTDDAARTDIADADAAYGTVPQDALAATRKLRWIQSAMAGPPRGYYYPELIAHSAVVTNVRGIYNDYIAPHIMAFVLAYARGLHLYIPEQTRAEWNRRPAGSAVQLQGTTALIVGVGGIGGETARLCAAFGIRAIGVDARIEQAPAGIIELHPPEELDRLLPQADWVIVTVPQTPQTEGMFDARRFALMKPTSFFVNIGRGTTVRLDALDQALRDGQIGGAGLDVFEVEPLPPEHPLWTAPNLIITPHVSGLGPDLPDRRLQVLVENCRRFAADEPLLNVVDKANWF